MDRHDNRGTAERPSGGKLAPVIISRCTIDIAPAVNPDNNRKVAGIRLVSLTELRREDVEIETVFVNAWRAGKDSKCCNLCADIAEVGCVERFLPLGNRLRRHPAQLTHRRRGVGNSQEFIHAILKQTVQGTLGGLYYHRRLRG